jgi:transposase-like protein
MCDSRRWTRENYEEIEVYGGADRLILRQGEEDTSVGEICRKAGISEATYYNWRKKYVGLMPSEMKRLRQLEEEHGMLVRLCK